MAAPVSSADRLSAPPTSPTLAKLQGITEAKDAYYRAQQKPFEEYIGPYLRIFEEFSGEDLKNHLESLRKNFKDNLSKTVNLKAVVKSYIEKNPDKAPAVCAILLENAYFTEAYFLSIPILEIIAELKINLGTKYLPLVNLLYSFCKYKDKTLVRDVSTSDLITKAYRAICIGNTAERKLLSETLKKSQVVDHNVYSKLLNNFMQGAILTSDIDLLVECIDVMNHYQLHLSVSYSGNIPGLLKTCLNALKEQGSGLDFEILQFLCNWSETIEVENFCRNLLPIVEGNPALTLVWLKKAIKSEETTLPHNLMALLRRQNVSKSPMVKEELMNILIYSLNHNNVCFRDELRKGINVLDVEPKNPSAPSPSNDPQKIMPKEKNYIYKILEHHFQRLRDKSKSGPLSAEDKGNIFLLLNYSLYIHGDNEFVSKCIEFIREFDFAKETPPNFDLTPLERTNAEQFIYEARAKKFERSTSKAVQKYLLNPSRGLNIDTVSELSEAYFSGTFLGINNFMTLCLDCLRTLKLNADDEKVLIGIYNETPKNKQRVVLQAYLETYFMGPDSRKPLASAISKLQLKCSIKALSLNRKIITETFVNSVSSCGFQISHFNLHNCVIEADAWPKIQSVASHQLTVNNPPSTIKVSPATQSLTLNGNVKFALWAVFNMQLTTLEFANFETEPFISDSANTFNILNRERACTLKDLRFSHPIGNFGDSETKIIALFPTVSSLSFQNSAVGAGTIDRIIKSCTRIESFSLITQRQWNELNDKLEEFVGRFNNTLKSFSFRNSLTKIDPGFIYALKGVPLRSLCLSGDLDNPFIDQLCKDHPKLRCFEIPYNPRIDDGSISSIIKMNEIEVLNIAGTGISASGILQLVKGLPKLTRITIGFHDSVLMDMLQDYEVFVETRDPNLPITVPKQNEPLKV